MDDMRKIMDELKCPVCFAEAVGADLRLADSISEERYLCGLVRTIKGDDDWYYVTQCGYATLTVLELREELAAKASVLKPELMDKEAICEKLAELRIAPCASCGERVGESYGLVEIREDRDEKNWRVKCVECESTGDWDDSRIGAIEAWNAKQADRVVKQEKVTAGKADALLKTLGVEKDVIRKRLMERSREIEESTATGLADQGGLGSVCGGDGTCGSCKAEGIGEHNWNCS